MGICLLDKRSLEPSSALLFYGSVFPLSVMYLSRAGCKRLLGSLSVGDDSGLGLYGFLSFFSFKKGVISTENKVHGGSLCRLCIFALCGFGGREVGSHAH